MYTQSDCDYGPSKVMPYMIPMGQFNRRPLIVHGLTLALNTRVELPDRYAKHPKDAPLLVKNRKNSGVCATLDEQEIRSLDHRCPLGSICSQGPPFTPSQWA